MKYLKVDLCHAGMDQRKIHMVAREVFPKMRLKKPVALHHHLISGLTEPPKVAGVEKEDEVLASKMSKSQPSSAIFIHDSEKEIFDKMKKAYCPEKVEGNPVLEIAKYIIFHERKEFAIDRDAKYGGNLEFGNYLELETAYSSKKLHAMDLKAAVAKELNAILEPVRKHFDNKKQLMEVFNEAKITR